MAQKVILYATDNPNIMVGIICSRKRSDGSYQLTGSVYDRYTNAPIERIDSLSRISRSENEIAEVRKRIIHMLTESYNQMQITEEIHILEAVENALDLLMKDVKDEKLRLSPTWTRVSTNSNALRYFSAHFLDLYAPFLQGEKDFLPSDAESIKEEIFRSVKDSKKNTNDANAANTTSRHLQDADIVYEHIRDHLPSLPEIRLCDSVSTKRQPLPEHKKHIPHDIFRRFLKRLEDDAEQYPAHVFAAVHVVFGCRIGEASGRLPSDITLYDTYCTSGILTQDDGNGKQTDTLKTEDSRRLIILCYWGLQLIKRCMNLLPNTEDIEPGTVLVPQRQLTPWIRERLLDAGLDDDLFYEMTADKDGNANTPSERTARLFRRMLATLCRTIMGLSLEATDDQMGHADNYSKQLISTNNLDDQRMIAEAMERYIFSPTYTLNPSLHPIEVGLDGNKHRLIPFSRYVFDNVVGRKVRVRLAFKSVEAGEPITLDLPASACKNISINSISLPVDHSGTDRQIIGNTTI